MGGKIELESAPERGTVVTIKFPQAEPHEPEESE